MRRGTERRLKARADPARRGADRAARASCRQTKREAGVRTCRRLCARRLCARTRATARPVSRSRTRTVAWRAPPRLRAARRRAAPRTGLEPWARAPGGRPLTSRSSARRAAATTSAPVPRPRSKKKKKKKRTPRSGRVNLPRRRRRDRPPAKRFPSRSAPSLGRRHDSPRPWPRPRPRPPPRPPPRPRPRPARSDVSRRRLRSRAACPPRPPRPRLRQPPSLDRDRRAPAPPRSPRASGFPRPRRATHPRRAPSRAGPRVSRGTSGRSALLVEGREGGTDASGSVSARGSGRGGVLSSLPNVGYSACAGPTSGWAKFSIAGESRDAPLGPDTMARSGLRSQTLSSARPDPRRRGCGGRSASSAFCRRGSGEMGWERTQVRRLRSRP